MEFKDVAQVVIEDRTPDGYGGYVTNEVAVGEIKVKTAPYRVAIGEMYAIPNPISSVKFFTNSKLPIDEELVFFVVWNNKKYKKVAFTEYGKCRLIIGELYESRYNS